MYMKPFWFRTRAELLHFSKKKWKNSERVRSCFKPTMLPTEAKTPLLCGSSYKTLSSPSMSKSKDSSSIKYLSATRLVTWFL
jgi:hypothetical protein